MEFVWFYTGEILLTYDGVTSFNDVFQLRFDDESTT